MKILLLKVRRMKRINENRLSQIVDNDELERRSKERNDRMINHENGNFWKLFLYEIRKGPPDYIKNLTNKVFLLYDNDITGKIQVNSNKSTLQQFGISIFSINFQLKDPAEYFLASENQKNTITVKCDQMGIDVFKFINSGKNGQKFNSLEEVTKEIAAAMIQRLSEYQQTNDTSRTIPDNIKKG